jgi:hypothetical protein
LWKEYSYGKQTYKQLAKKYRKSIRWIQTVLDDYWSPACFAEPCKTPLVIDATFFGRTKGVLVFRSPTLRKNLGWYDIETETVDLYELGVLELLGSEFEITGITVDGKPGVLKRFSEIKIPVQMCHFHMLCIVTRYTTKRPRLLAAQELRRLTKLLPKTDQESFEHWLQEWHTKWNDFLNEKTWDEEQKRWWFTHKRLRQAYRSLVRHLPYLFTYHHHPDMPNTTNSLDGSFSHLKDRLRVHRGLRWSRKLKLIEELLR